MREVEDFLPKPKDLEVKKSKESKVTFMLDINTLDSFKRKA